jgi:parallel beta-helix repeat protein
MSERRSLKLIAGFHVLCLSVGSVTHAQPAGPLPGARPVIDAANYPTLQAALDAVPKEGGLVRIPPGIYEIKEPLVIRGDDVHLTGAGTSTHIKNLNTDARPAIAVHPPEPFVRPSPRARQTSRWRVQISNLRVTGNEKSGNGIDALWVNEIFLHGLSISEHGGDGIFLDNCYEDPRISDCLITYNKQTGVNLLGCHDIVVSANQFEENQDALHCIDGFNLCMTGNNVDDHLGNGVIIENTYGSVVSGNMIEECAGWAVILDRDCYGDTVSANVIAHNGGGVDCLDAHGCAVSANTFTLLKEHAVRIGPNSGRITVTGNNFSNSFIGDGAVKRGTNDLAAAGITLEGTSDVSITGNVFSSLTTKAIAVIGEPTKRSIVANNVFTDVESDHAKVEGIVAGNIEP